MILYQCLTTVESKIYLPTRDAGSFPKIPLLPNSTTETLPSFLTQALGYHKKNMSPLLYSAKCDVIGIILVTNGESFNFKICPTFITRVQSIPSLSCHVVAPILASARNFACDIISSTQYFFPSVGTASAPLMSSKGIPSSTSYPGGQGGERQSCSSDGMRLIP